MISSTSVLAGVAFIPLAVRFFLLRNLFRRGIYLFVVCWGMCLTVSAQTNVQHGLDFDGVNDKVTIPDNNNLDMTNNYTLEVWIYPTQFIHMGGIIDKYQSSGANGYMIRYEGTSGRVNFDERSTTGNVLTLNTWNHLAAVNDNGTRRLYVNGVEVALGSSSFSVSSNGDPIRLGTDFNDPARSFKGKMDEVRIWNVVRTSAQINASMNQMLYGTETGLVAYYRFDQYTAAGSNAGQTMLTNLTSISGNNGTLENFSLSGSTSNWVSGYTGFTPLVSTTTASSVTGTGATGGGEVQNSGGSAVVAKGLVWSTTTAPTVALTTKTSDGSGTGIFTSAMTGLSTFTTYYYRTYATNATGTAYGPELSLTTPQLVPVISYTASTVTLGVGTPANIALTNTGGTPEAVQVSTYAGNGITASANGSSQSSSFNFPVRVVRDAGGNLYVSDYASHRIRKISTAGDVTTLAGWSTGYVDDLGTAASFNSPMGLALDGSGNLYVADMENNRIRKITPAGLVTTVAGGVQGFADATGTAAKFNRPSALAMDGSGNLFVAELGGLRIRKIVLSSRVVSTLAGNGAQGIADGTGSAATFTAPIGLTIDGSGNLFLVDFSNNSIRKITSAGVVTTLAGGTSGFADGTGTAAKFNSPYDISIDNSGNLYVADKSNNRIRKITQAGVVTTIAGSITGYADGVSTLAKFRLPSGLTVDADGNIYVADYANKRIRRISRYRIEPTLPEGLLFDANSGSITGTPLSASAAKVYTVYAENTAGTTSVQIAISVASLPTAITEAAMNVTATTATIGGTINANGSTTSALTLKYSTVQADVDAGNGTVASVTPTSATGNAPSPHTAAITGLLTGTTYYYRISATNAAGTTHGATRSFTTAASAPVISYPGASTPVTLSVGTPMTALTISNSGGSPDPMQVSNFVGSFMGFADGTGAAGKFNNPLGLSVDAVGNLYTADYNNQRIRKITPAGVVTTFAGSTSGYVDATGSSAKFYYPHDLVIDAGGMMYVSENGQLIRKITTAGEVSTLAGSGTAGNADGTGTAAQFFSPRGMAVDAGGNLYVADNVNHRIRKITPAGVVTSFVGSTSGFTNGTSGSTGAKFNYPAGMAMDGSGNIYVADQSNHSIRKITPAGIVSTFAGTSMGYADGAGTAAKFYFPYGVAMDGSGNLYVTDQNNHRIRKITPAGDVTTIAGNGVAANVDGSGTSARLNTPKGITIDGSGNIYVTDNNALIRKISKYAISPALPAGLTFNTSTGEVSGTPAAITATQTYTVTAANPGGSSSVSFSLGVSAPVMTTAAASIGQTTATSGGTVGSNFTGITERGLVWHTSANPTIFHNKIVEGGTTTGTFTVNLTGLTPLTTYYIRSYVTYGGSSTTEYGDQRTFMTNSLGSFTNITKTYGNAKFSLTAPVAVSSGSFSFSSSNTAVATISGREVTITGPGTSIITATQAAYGAYATTSKSMILTVNKATPVIMLNIPTTTTLAAASNMSITGTASNGEPVTISIGSGTATGTLSGTPGSYLLNGVSATGNLVFNSSTSATPTHHAGAASLTMDVTKNNQAISFGSLTPVTYSNGLTQSLTATTTATGLSVNFTVVSGPGSLTGNTLNITGTGDIVITASQAGNSTYNSAPEITRTLTVNPAPPAIISFTPTSAKEGDEVTITGEHFENVSSVSFGGTAATSFNVVSATSITAVVGTGLSGSVSVTTTSGTDTVAGFRYKVIWTGATNAFNTSSNWTGNRPPQTDDDIIFSPTAASDLELDGSKTVGHVDFNGSSKSLKLGAYNLTVKGNLTMPGNITGTGKVIMQGGSAQTIRGGGVIPDLEINNSNGVSIDGSGEELTVSGTLRSTFGTLTTNGKLRLMSNSGGTARVGVVAGAITGNVIAERFIQRSNITDATGRAWRLVSVPVTGTGTLRDFFMNGRAGLDLTLQANRDAETESSGTPIVGHNYTTAAEATTAGFDWIGVPNQVSSLRYYTGDASGGSFASEHVPIMTTDYANAAQGYMVYARGDRKLDFPSSTSSGVTTLRSTGSLKTGAQTVSVAPATSSKYTLVGNPYMSVLNLDAFYTTNSTVINPSFWIWDGTNIAGTNNQGGYVNVYKSGTQWVTNTGAYINPELLESGMAFFVEPVTSLSIATNISIMEAHKSSSANATNWVIDESIDIADDHGRMYIRLERADAKGQRQIIDGVMADFHTSFRETLTDMTDREKLRNGISRGALWISRNSKLLSGEGLPWPKDVKRSIPLSMSGVGDQTLLVHINPTGMRDRYVKAWLKDNVLKREVEINMNQPFDYDFIGTGRSDWDSTRFEILYVEAGRPGTGVTLEPDDVAESPSVKLYPNPSKSAEVKLSLRAMAPGSYSVHLLDMTGRLVATTTLEHRSMNGEYRVLQGRLLAPGQYLIRLMDADKQLKETLRMMVE